MTSTSVSEVRAFFLNQLNQLQGAGVMSTGSSESFSDIFQKTAGQKAGASVQNDAQLFESQEAAADPVEYVRETAAEAADEVQQSGAGMEDTLQEKAVEEAAGKMVKAVADKLQVSEEEVKAAMESLGLTALDLLSAENLAMIAVALNPEMDSLNLMTNGELFADIKDLMNTAQGLLQEIGQEFGLSAGQLQDLLASMQEAARGMQEAPVAGNDLLFSDMAEVVGSENEAVQEVPADAAAVAEEELLMAGRSNNDAAEGLQSTAGEELPSGFEIHTGRTEKESGRENSQMGQNHQSLAQNVMDQLNQAAEAAFEKSSLTYTGSAQDIVSQMLEFIKVQVKPGVTELQLQLQPENLGTINIHLTSKEGMITALFTTENEMVKSAVEAQMVQLKDSLNEQGIKVDAVEVTIASHGFERNLNQEGEGREASSDLERERRSHRRIRIGDTEEGVEALSEEDEVIADMMLRNGNTIDYTA